MTSHLIFPIDDLRPAAINPNLRSGTFRLQQRGVNSIILKLIQLGGPDSEAVSYPTARCRAAPYHTYETVGS